MIAEVTAVPPARFLTWVKSQETALHNADVRAEACRQELSSQHGAQSVEFAKNC
jgi:hypothetical protein